MDHVTFGICFYVTRVRTWIERPRCRWNSTTIKRMRKQWKPGPFLLPFSGLGTRLGCALPEISYSTIRSMCSVILTRSCKDFFLGMHTLTVRYPAIVLGLSVMGGNSNEFKCRWRAMPQQFRVTHMRRGTTCGEFRGNSTILTRSWVGFNITSHHQQHFIHKSRPLPQCIEYYWLHDQLVEVDLIRTVTPNSSGLMEAEEYATLQHSPYETQHPLPILFTSFMRHNFTPFAGRFMILKLCSQIRLWRHETHRYARLCTCCLFGHYHPSQHGSVVCTTTLEGGCCEGPTRFHAGLREEVSCKVLLISLLCRYGSGNKLVGSTQQKLVTCTIWLQLLTNLPS